jgi:single-stranded-DNA-specific exonuclease
VPIHEVIGNCDDLLTSHGGHAMAAGVRLEATNLEEFRTRLTEQINTILEPEDLIHTIDVDDTCTIDQLDTPLVAQIERLAPFGRANPSPRLCLRHVRVDAPPQRVGGEGRHLRLTLRQNNRSAKAIGFGLGDVADQLTAGMHLDLVIEPKISHWQGRKSVDLHLKDLKRAETANTR